MAAEEAPVLSGAHPFHFPVYWERAEWLLQGPHTLSGADSLPDWRASELEVAIVDRWRSLHGPPGGASGGDGSPVFKYRLGSEREPLETRPLPGRLGMVAQKALGRAGKRKPPAAIRKVATLRDPAAFSFGDARWSELLLAFDGPPVSALAPPSLPAADASAPLLPRGGEEGGRSVELPAHSVLVNVAPFCAFHFVLATDLAELQPQVLTERSLRVALGFVRHFSRFLRLTYNSLGAGASVNHLHWQGMYFREPLPIELRPRRRQARRGALLLEAVEGWPLEAWAFTAGAGSDPEELAAAVFPLVQRFLEWNLAHNLCLVNSDGAVRLFIFARRLANFPDPSHTQVAATEALGYWIVPRQEEYESLTAQDAAALMASVAAWGANGSLVVQEVLAPSGWVFDPAPSGGSREGAVASLGDLEPERAQSGDLARGAAAFSEPPVALVMGAAVVTAAALLLYGAKLKQT
uniref:GDP-D-glucose phosphorylase 1 n=1 Tax=Alexandrium monilatum TaxID=311494 RepID=A0A7S4T5W8_9DINO